MGNGHGDDGWEMAHEETVGVVEVRAYKDGTEADKIGCKIFLSDWLDLMPDQLVKDLLEMVSAELAELAKEFDPLRGTPPRPGPPERFQFKNGRRGN